MQVEFEITQGNTLPFLDVQLKYVNGRIADLTDVDPEGVTFSMRAVEGNNSKRVVNDGICTILNALEGLVRFAFLAKHTEAAGRFKGQFTVTLPDGVLSFPNDDDYILVTVNPKV